jgi:hypothetical protein
MPKYIIFLDDNLKGYLDDEVSARKAITDLANSLIDNLKSEENMRVFQETVEQGINIYSQSLGKYINGPVYHCHKIEYRLLPEYGK